MYEMLFVTSQRTGLNGKGKKLQTLTEVSGEASLAEYWTFEQESYCCKCCMRRMRCDPVVTASTEVHHSEKAKERGS